PALDIKRLKPTCQATVLSTADVSESTIFVETEGPLCDVAGAICEIIRTHGGPAPNVYPGSEFELLDLTANNAIVLGGAHENPAAALLCDRGWLDADLRFPGPGGWLLRTVHNVEGLEHNIVHLCADASTHEQALDALRQRVVTRGHSVVIDPVIEARLSDETREFVGDWGTWQRRLAAISFRAHGLDYREIEDVTEYGRWLAECFDCGGPEGDRYNRWPLMASATAGRLYLITGDRRYLQLYREITLELIRYHCNFPGGASYLADYDFAVHQQILYWDLLEEEDVFSDEERLIVTNFMLSSARMSEGHLRTHNPQPGRLRHNHETFAMLSVYMGGRYFGDYYDVDDTERWLEEAEDGLTGPIERCVKHREDANLYQWIVPRHKLIWDLRNGVYTYRDNGVLEGLAHHIINTTDNLGWPSDFGDAGSPVSGGMGVASLLETSAAMLEMPELQWWVEKIINAVPQGSRGLPGGADLFGMKRVKPIAPEEQPTLDVLPLQKHVREMAAPEMPRMYVYDKAALRDGFAPEDAYLLLDGYSVGSHIHYDQNAIIRYTAAGRLWLVDNAYGKPSGEAAAQKAYSSREVGPQDHNTLLVITPDGEIAKPPPFCALLTTETDGPLTVVQSALAAHSGVDWLRTIVWIEGAGVLLIDQTNVIGEVGQLRCQLNMLGEISVEESRLTCAQQDRWMHMAFETDTEVETRGWTNANWDDEFESGAYPYAERPINKFERIATPAEGDSVCFATLIETGASNSPALEMNIDGDTLAVTGALPEEDASVRAEGFSARLSAGTLTVQFAAPWNVPDDLPRLPAEDDRYMLNG
ncbi:MAG: hypothetical protein ACOCZ7_04535, partial [Armatimonadota bacterium]